MQTANYENLNQRQVQLKQEISNTISDLDRARMKKEDIAKGFYEIEANRNKILKSMEEIENKKQEINDKINCTFKHDVSSYC